MTSAVTPRRIGWHRWGMLGLVTVSLGVAVGAQVFWTARGKSEKSVQPPPLLPVTLPGWSARDLPIGPTEVASGNTKSVLNFDRFEYREFSRGSRRITVYAAYWSPGRMPPHLVASHTPDQCWTANGWGCDAYGRISEIPGDTAHRLPPAEWRLFRAPDGAGVYVYYWHRVGSASYDFGGQRFNSVPHVWAWVRGALRHFRGQSQPQTS